MAIVTVSSPAELKKALDFADRGDKILLEAGNYGTLSLNGKSKVADYTFDGITIASKSGTNPAAFNAVNLTGVTNITFDNIKFDYNNNSDTNIPFMFNETRGISIINSEIDGMVSGGYGTGQGLWVKDSSAFLLQNSEITNFTKGLVAYDNDSLKVVGNSFDNIAVDAMIFGRVHGVLIEDNSVDMHGKAGTLHRDAIQFWNNDTNDPAQDVVIRGNTLIAGESNTHGIFMANDLAQKGGLETYYRNILIENNTIKNGQVCGILVGETVGLTIRNNTVLQHADIDSSKPVAIPMIMVDAESRQVSITGNTTHKTPEAVSSSDNWQTVDDKPTGWTITNNRIVDLGATGGAASGGAPAAPAPADPGGNDGNGAADSFRFNGTNITGSERVVFNNVDFKEGDVIKLSYFDAGTFNHYAGDNVVAANADKSFVQIGSLTDIQEVVTAAKAVSALFQANDTLVMQIVQDTGTLDIALPGLADDYRDSFNGSLF